MAILDGMERTATGDVARSERSALFGWAIERGDVESNPTMHVKKRSESKRDRTLKESELAEVWCACQEDDYGRISAS